MRIIKAELFFDKSIKIIGRIVLISVLILPMILLYHSIPFFTGNSLYNIFFSDWKPSQNIYGLRSFIFTTLIVSIISALVAYVFSFSLAIYLYFNKNKLYGKYLFKIIKIMSGIPTVVYGLAGILIIVPIIREHTPSASGFCLLSVIIVLCILIIPTITTYMINGLNLIPQNIKTAGLSLGANEYQLFFKILLPEAKKYFIIAFVLGLTRAMSDTMIALMLSGNSFRFPTSIFQSSRNVTSQIALLIPGEFSGTEFKSIFFLALVLIVIVIFVDILVIKLEKK